MATNTTNFNLKKPAYTDTADIADINGNMDKVDASLNGLADAIAIVANNNTHAAITAGQYVYVHGHGSLAEGLYTARSNISANATLSTSNLQADGSGGLNALNSNISSNMNWFNKEVALTSSQNILTVALDTTLCPVREVRYFDLRESNNSGVPTVYGVGVVMKRNVNNPLVLIYGDTGNIYYNTYNFDQSAWRGWKQVTMTSV